MIDIYFVRHGQTGGNTAKRHQAEHTPLNEKGHQQAKEAGLWAKTVAPTHLFSSRHVRTLQTARHINESIDKTIQTNEAFIELQRPEKIYGYKHKSLRSVLYLLFWYLGFVGDEGSDTKGESYQAFRQRLQRAQEELQGLPDESRVIVVSHAVFIGFMISHMCDSDPASLRDAFRIFFKMLKLHNAGYSHVQYNPEAPDGVCKWQLMSYDNHEHIKK